ncbi:GNAT family N-acetyltransferase [Frigoribacterium sp. 2-23]|uniref:GNAT family N-acetyltransferase n=1 Tax=Frigoribacterium sp. 2-23 TaxID=3415006 RepID=UPI003C6F43A5
MTVTSRPATASDASELSEVAALTFPLACPPGTELADIARFVTTVLSEERFVEYLADDARVVTVIVDDAGAIVGYSMLVGGDPSEADVATVVTARPTIELSKFYLVSDTHGTGAAATLMTATLEAAADTGAATVWLGVNRYNERANRFYEKNGFGVVGAKRFVVGDQVHDDHVRERTLR